MKNKNKTKQQEKKIPKITANYCNLLKCLNVDT